MVMHGIQHRAVQVEHQACVVGGGCCWAGRHLLPSVTTPACIGTKHLLQPGSPRTLGLCRQVLGAHSIVHSHACRASWTLNS